MSDKLKKHVDELKIMIIQLTIENSNLKDRLISLGDDDWLNKQNVETEQLNLFDD